MGSVASAASPMATCTHASSRTVSAALSMRLRTHRPPKAIPRMNAESMSSKACVELPSTSASIRIHPISYMKEDMPVRQATTRSRRSCGTGAAAAAAAAGAAATASRRPGSSIAATATERFSTPAAASVPGRPTAGMK